MPQFPRLENGENPCRGGCREDSIKQRGQALLTSTLFKGRLWAHCGQVRTAGRRAPLGQEAEAAPPSRWCGSCRVSGPDKRRCPGKGPRGAPAAWAGRGERGAAGTRPGVTAAEAKVSTQHREHESQAALSC